MSANISGTKGNSDPIEFSGRYMDPNAVTYEVSPVNLLTDAVYSHRVNDQFHTGVPAELSHTALGDEITDGLKALAEKYQLNDVLGYAPQHYPLGSSSLSSLLADRVSIYIKM